MANPLRNLRLPFRGALHKSFLERSPMAIGAIGLAVLATFSVLGLLLQGGAFKSTYHVRAFFTDAAAVQPSDYVTVAGLQAGKVSDVSIVNGKVAIDMDVDSSVKLPVDSSAAIQLQTLLGRKVIALTPGASSKEIRDGDVIPESRTRTPVTVLDLNNTSVNLLRASDARAFDKMLAEITTVTKGKRDQLGSLIDGLTKVAKAIDVKQAALSRLIDSMQTLGATFADKSNVVVSLIDRIDVVLHNLAQHRSDLVRLVRTTDAASHATADLVNRNRNTLDSSLSNLHTTMDVVGRHQLDLAASVSYLDAAVRGYSSVGYSQGIPNHWANIYVESLGPIGVDAIAGCGGVLDNALDKLLGPAPCNSGSTGGGSGGGGVVPPILNPKNKGGGGSLHVSKPKSPVDTNTPALPGNVGDLIHSVTGTGSVGGGL